MKKIISIILVIHLLVIVGCNSQKRQIPKEYSFETSAINDTVTIQEIVEWCNSTEWTIEEAQHMDSLNEKYGLPVLCAERNLDTIINHYHIIFSTRRD